MADIKQIFKVKETRAVPMSAPARQIPVEDYTVKKNINTLEGTIEKVPVNDNDIVNKAYADSLISGGGTTWGAIIGTLSDQTDLQSELDSISGSIITDHRDLTFIGTNTHAQIDTHIASTSNPHSVTLDQLGNPTGNAEFNMNGHHFQLLYVAPVTGGGINGAFEIEATGNFSGDLMHIHQSGGNPGPGTDLLHLEAIDTDVTPLRIVSNSTYDIVCDGISVGSITTSGTIDGVDIAGFKSDYDIHTHTESDITDLGSYYLASEGASHTGDSTIHYTQASISIPASQVSDFDTEVANNTDVAANTSARHSSGSDTTLGSGCVAQDHGTASTAQVINVCYGTGSTPPTASTTTEGTLYIQYTA